MSWHLIDKERERELNKATDGHFSKALTKVVETGSTFAGAYLVSCTLVIGQHKLPCLLMFPPHDIDGLLDTLGLRCKTAVLRSRLAGLDTAKVSNLSEVRLSEWG